MGPAATVDFYDKLVRATPVIGDQDHLRVIIWADPTVPDRSKALLEGGEDPTPWLEHGIRQLMACGAEILVIPCNTIHAFVGPVLTGKKIEFISIIDAAVDAASRTDSTGKVGLLATSGTLASGLYQSALQSAGIAPALLAESAQATLMQIIYTVKEKGPGAGGQHKLKKLLAELRASGVMTTIVGCTEVSTLLRGAHLDMNIIDASQALAAKTVDLACNAAPTVTIRQ